MYLSPSFVSLRSVYSPHLQSVFFMVRISQLNSSQLSLRLFPCSLMKLTPSLGMLGTIPPLPHTFSWRCAFLSTGTLPSPLTPTIHWVLEGRRAQETPWLCLQLWLDGIWTDFLQKLYTATCRTVPPSYPDCGEIWCSSVCNVTGDWPIAGRRPGFIFL